MNENQPLGAISEEERTYLNLKSMRSHYHWTGKNGYYAVMQATGDLSIGGTRHTDGNGLHTFSFAWDPSTAYYFTNYWFALAYSLRLKHARRIK